MIVHAALRRELEALLTCPDARCALCGPCLTRLRRLARPADLTPDVTLAPDAAPRQWPSTRRASTAGRGHVWDPVTYSCLRCGMTHRAFLNRPAGCPPAAPDA